MTYKKVNLPNHLCDEAEEYIKTVIDYLKKNDKLNSVDTGIIHLLATSYDQYIKATEVVNKEGLTVAGSRNLIVPHPAVKIAKDAKSTALNVMTQMGLTLKARTKLTAIDTDSEDSPLVDLMKKF